LVPISASGPQPSTSVELAAQHHVGGERPQGVAVGGPVGDLLRQGAVEAAEFRQRGFQLGAALDQGGVGEHPAGGLVGEDEQPGDVARGIEDAGIREGPPRVPGAPVGVELPGQVDEALRPARQGGVDDRLGLIPGIGPDGIEPRPHGPGQSRPEQREVGVVEEEMQIGPPGQDHRFRRVEHEGERRAELRRPCLRGAEGVAGPVARADHARGFAAAGEEGERVGHGVRTVHVMGVGRMAAFGGISKMPLAVQGRRCRAPSLRAERRNPGQRDIRERCADWMASLRSHGRAGHSFDPASLPEREPNQLERAMTARTHSRPRPLSDQPSEADIRCDAVQGFEIAHPRLLEADEQRRVARIA